jgi:ABC-type uncharacterized transport system fused permease/ATPase subunit
MQQDVEMGSKARYHKGWPCCSLVMELLSPSLDFLSWSSTLEAQYKNLQLVTVRGYVIFQCVFYCLFAFALMFVILLFSL